MKLSTISPHPVSICALALLVGIGCSWPLWLPFGRVHQLPVVPLIGNGFASASGIDWVLFLLLSSVLLWLVVRPQHRVGQAGVLLLICLLCGLDLNRIQPWLWLYFLIFSVFFIFFKKDNTVKMHLLKCLLASVYFWSGLHKINPYFVTGDFVWFCSAFSFLEKTGEQPALGYTLAITEMLLGLCLLVPRTELLARYLLLLFHAIVLVFLLRLGWNWVVLPWNIAMMWLVRPQPTTTPSPLGTVGQGSRAVFFLLPLLTHFTPLPRVLGWHLYDNTQPEAVFFIKKSDGSKPPLPAIWDQYAFDDGTKLLLDDWAIQDLKVPLFYSNRTFEVLAKRLCEQANTADSSGLLILKVNAWNRLDEQIEQIPCTLLYDSK
jgi:hypothetical protein